MYQHCISTSYFDSNLMPAPGAKKVSQSAQIKHNSVIFGWGSLKPMMANVPF
jgi:hypothetical protein